MKTNERIRQRREEIGMSIRGLAEKVNMSPSTIMRYEKGEISKLDIEKVQVFARALHCTPEYLMGWEEEYYMDPDTADAAKRIFENNQLRLLFDAAKTASSEDLETTYNMLLALKRKEQNRGDD